MFVGTLYYGDVVQVVLVAVSFILVLVSANAYRRRTEGRYLFLLFAFGSLCVLAADTAFMELFPGAGPLAIQLLELYLNPSLEVLMVVFFLLAILWSRTTRKVIVIVGLIAIVAVGLGASVSYESASSKGNDAGVQAPLPAGCTKPGGGFLIVASSLGYNDSLVHGAPSTSWPVLDVTAGTNVSITVCNAYVLPVGFQVAHYLDEKIVSLAPGQTIKVSFLASVVGVFPIYCSVFNPLHLFLQGGKLVVS